MLEHLFPKRYWRSASKLTDRRADIHITYRPTTDGRKRFLGALRLKINKLFVERGWSRKTGYHANGFQKQEGQEHLERGWSRKTGQQANGIHGQEGQEHLERGWSKKTGQEANGIHEQEGQEHLERGWSKKTGHE